MPSRRRGGFTLLEGLVALGLASVLLFALYEIMALARKEVDDGIEGAALSIESTELLQRIVDELQSAGASSPDWSLDPFGGALTYNLSQGVQDGAIVWGPARTMTLLPTGGQPEGAEATPRMALVIEDEDGQVSETWSQEMAEDGLLFHLEDHVLGITVRIRRTDLLEATGSVGLRN